MLGLFFVFSVLWFLFVLIGLLVLWILLCVVLFVLIWCCFSGVVLLFGFMDDESMMDCMLWWLLLMWMLLIVVLIIGFVGLVLNFEEVFDSDGLFLVVFDGSWVLGVVWL